jgi:CRISPR system Cascade subunit CasB
MASREQIDRFVSYLEGLERRGDRGALARLRRGAGRRPGDAVDMLPLVVPFLPPGDWDTEVFFTAASLFALHPEAGGGGNFGATFRALGDYDSAKKRFAALLDCHEDELGEHLRHAVTLARSKGARIDYRQLLWDLTHWTHPDGFVQLEWARAYWGRPATQTDHDTTN